MRMVSFVRVVVVVVGVVIVPALLYSLIIFELNVNAFALRNAEPQHCANVRNIDVRNRDRN